MKGLANMNKRTEQLAQAIDKLSREAKAELLRYLLYIQDSSRTESPPPVFPEKGE